MSVVSIPRVAADMTQAFQPVDLARANDAIVRMARLEGAFDWHTHDEDELFLCWSGSFRVEHAGGESAELHAGDIHVVPAGTPHRPVADAPAYTLMIERPETEQRG
jgi:mannose-6-phosphate isomerase-like protein (cupin superfamily)